MDEPTVPPQKLPNPERLSAEPQWSNKRKRQFFFALLIGGSLMVLFAIHNTPKATVPPAEKTKPIQRLETPAPAAQQLMTTPPAEAPQQVMLPPVQSVPANYGEAPEKPEKTLKQQLEEQRKQLEMKSMFDDNIVSTSSQGPNRHGIAEPTAGPESSSSTNSSLGAILPGTPVPVSTKKTKLDFDPNQPTWILPEGTVINCALVNKLNGDFTGPVLVQVSTDVVAPSTRVVVIPQGSRIVGEASKVGSTGQERLAVAFHRLLIPTVSGPYSVSLDKATPGLDQEGATALKDKVNNHYASIFGASLAIGAIGGLAQIGNNYGANGYSSGGQFRNGVTESMAQSSMRVLDRFLNRMPTVEIRPGTRVNVILLEDLEVPAYASE